MRSRFAAAGSLLARILPLPMLAAGGYNGSTYTLTYDPASDTLKGVYFQAVAQQRFNVYFTRVR